MHLRPVEAHVAAQCRVDNSKGFHEDIRWLPSRMEQRQAALTERRHQTDATGGQHGAIVLPYDARPPADDRIAQKYLQTTMSYFIMMQSRESGRTPNEH